MNEAKYVKRNSIKWILLSGTAAAIASTLCCIAPLILFSLGISGAWISSLTAMESYKPYFLTSAILLIALGFWKVYRKPNHSDCKQGTFCAMSASDRINKIMLWIALIIIGLVLLYPYLAPIILERL
ncbi:MerT mercuric transport protein [Legionella steelei]|uniref:Mercuric transport protein MerT n=2 Tax=Legionellaceae TaxID=444 RepID=A0A0W0ZS66_9GAMM|nr:MerT mercuric transport protein [Legionella steelei]